MCACRAIQGNTDLNEAVHQLEMLRMRGELTPDAVAEMMGRYMSTASATSSTARPTALNRHHKVSYVLVDKIFKHEGQKETFS